MATISRSKMKLTINNDIKAGNLLTFLKYERFGKFIFNI